MILRIKNAIKKLFNKIARKLPKTIIKFYKISSSRVKLYKTPIGDYYLPTDVEKDIIVNSMKLGKVFEEEIVILTQRYIKKDSTVLDVGSNLGQMTIFFSSFVGENGKVYSFEADDFIFGLLEKNIKINRCENVLAINKAVYDTCGNKMFYPVQDFKRFDAYGSYGLSPNAKEGREVETITIDSLNITTPISFMKVDVQGSDLFTLRGAVETIKRFRMPIIFEYEEQFQDEFNTSWQDYVDFIKSIDYKIDKVVNEINYLIVPN